MPATSIQSPFPIFTDIDGQPLEAGLIWFGTAGNNPISSPITAYWDAALTQVVTQPVTTRGGYPLNGTAIGRLYVNADYSILVRNRSGSDVLSALNATERYDSSLVTFIQAGAGAVTRTAQAKMREVVSVKDFGAVGDGVADDTVAIQAAINYCTNLSNRKQTLYFPANSAAAYYKITAPLVITSRLNIVGDGEFSTRIQAVGMSIGQFVLDWDCLAIDVVYSSGISNISIGSNNNNPTGIRLKNISYMLMKHVTLTGLYKGIYITGTNTFSNFFEQVTGYAISSYTVHWESFTGGGQYLFSGCTFTGNDGVFLSSTAETDALAFYDCNFEQCNTTDAYINGTVGGLTFSGCRSEGLNGAASFLITPAAGKYVRGITVNGCNWTTDFGNAYAIDIGGDVSGFNISGNYGRYIGLLSFIRLNGAGQAGVISGNYCENSPAVVNAARDGVVIFGNYNSLGALPDNWGSASWSVLQGSYTGTGTGFTTTPTVTIKYGLVGNTVTLDIADISATSNSADFTITGMPAGIRPASQKQFITAVVNNGSLVMARIRVETSGVITMYADLAGNGFTASGTKSLVACSVSYTLA